MSLEKAPIRPVTSVLVMLLVKTCEMWLLIPGPVNAALCEEDVHIYGGPLHLAATEWRVAPLGCWRNPSCLLLPLDSALLRVPNLAPQKGVSDLPGGFCKCSCLSA